MKKLKNKDLVLENEGVKYSQLLEQLIKPFVNDFQEDYSVDDIFEFAINVWNFANIKALVPKDEFDESTFIKAGFKKDERKLFLEMIDYKSSEFADYDRFIIDFEWYEQGKEIRLVVLTGDQEHFKSSIEEKVYSKPIQEDLEPNYINRFAIVVKPKAPFFEWLNKYYSDDPPEESITSNIYLIDVKFNDIEKWLKKKFDKIFTMELEDWHSIKKEWPQRRNYNMFKTWFSVSVSSSVYDLESRPISKEY